jgi:hypothetical protein
MTAPRVVHSPFDEPEQGGDMSRHPWLAVVFVLFVLFVAALSCVASVAWVR